MASVDTLPPAHLEAEAVAKRQRERLLGFGVFAALLVAAWVVGHEVPDWMDLDVQGWAQDRYTWTIQNSDTHWLFTVFLNPASDFLNWAVEHVFDLLEALRWPGVVALTAMIGWRTGGPRAALAGGLAMLAVGAVAPWDKAMLTLSIMVVAVVMALVVGVPLGVIAARSDRAEKIIRVVLDTAQVMPVYVYFAPLLTGFGIGYPPAVMATFIYALPPATRLTNLGIRQVPVVLNEVGQSFGTTSWQQLLKVQLPVARKSILLGLNQVIMMAFAIVVLASLFGPSDLGRLVLNALQKQEVGEAFAAGIGIVLLAVALDRISTGDRRPLPRWMPTPPQWGRRVWLALGIGTVVAAVVCARAFELDVLPSWMLIDAASPIDDAVDWVQNNLRKDVPVIGGTQAISDFLVVHIIDPIQRFLLWLPWLAVVTGVAFVGWLSRGWRLAAGVALCLVLIGFMGTVPGAGGRKPLWDEAMNTLSQVIVAIVLAVLIAFPLGVWAGRSDRVERVLKPFLDLAQVLPQFVYLIPVVFLFSAGRAAGVVACVVYAIPPLIRLTALGLREVPHAPREAATSFGATPRQELLHVQLPLARKAILLGVNQTVLMVLATVIIAALVGAGGLGLLAYTAAAKPNVNLGQGMAGGLSIVFLAIMLDRITQAWGRDPDTSRT
ncbi:MAG TPA: glycine/betaine ABC transporter permease [Acidimicrobiaceae bacterium]|nr:glycine/betaine ABC transporter permease [Acidimicrobiaceae bacterium]